MSSFNFELVATSFDNYYITTRGCWRNQYDAIIVETLKFFAHEEGFPYDIEGIPTDTKSDIGNIILKSTRNQEYIEVRYPKIKKGKYGFYNVLFMEHEADGFSDSLLTEGNYFKITTIRKADNESLQIEGEFKTLQAIEYSREIIAASEVLIARMAVESEYGPKDMINWFTSTLKISQDEIVNFEILFILKVKNAEIVSATARKLGEYVVSLDDKNNIKYVTKNFSLIQRSFSQEYALTYTEVGDIDAETLAELVKDAKSKIIDLAQEVATFNNR